ncbi:MAG: hypothetical protein NXY57DRAFT_199548 [Lentinula lateritia]|nr:MAG: hypothetical protein NXY57DRAFT_199548 [Lentinula lateritia]
MHRFFSNTGAVAGTFAAVGVVVVIIAIIFITSTIRRRRQKRFDREMDEAAMEAAGTEVPPFLDDDDEPKPYGASAYGGGYGPSGGYGAQGDWSSSGAGGGGYSDTASHGTYAQPPMSHESYPMHDFGPSHNPGVGVGGVYDPTGAFAGGAAAAVSVQHAMSDNSRSNGSSTAIGDSPYPAFLQHDVYENSGGGVGPGGYPTMGRGGGFNNDVIAGGAAGMAGIGRRSSMNATALNRMKSQNSTGALSAPSSGSSHPAQPESYASHFTPGYAGPSQQDSMNRSTSAGSGLIPEANEPGFIAAGANFSPAVHDAAFGQQNQQTALPNPFTARLESDENADGGAEDPYGGYGSEEEEEQPRKVLKVANE